MMAGEGKNIFVYLPIVISHYLPTRRPHSPHHALQISRLYHHHVHPRLDEGQHACVACQGLSQIPFAHASHHIFCFSLLFPRVVLRQCARQLGQGNKLPLP